MYLMLQKMEVRGCLATVLFLPKSLVLTSSISIFDSDNDSAVAINPYYLKISLSCQASSLSISLTAGKVNEGVLKHGW